LLCFAWRGFVFAEHVVAASLVSTSAPIFLELGFLHLFLFLFLLLLLIIIIVIITTCCFIVVFGVSV
jgi:hypothetical protein